MHEKHMSIKRFSNRLPPHLTARAFVIGGGPPFLVRDDNRLRLLGQNRDRARHVPPRFQQRHLPGNGRHKGVVQKEPDGPNIGPDVHIRARPRVRPCRIREAKLGGALHHGFIFHGVPDAEGTEAHDPQHPPFPEPPGASRNGRLFERAARVCAAGATLLPSTAAQGAPENPT